MKKNFLTAEWRKLIIANYAVDPEFLNPYLPAQTELDLWNGTCYVSLVGFMFLNTKVKGMKVPFHVNFEEVNLRFYVKHQTAEGLSKRGVVFIKEIVPKPALAWVANTIFKEHYEARPMRHQWLETEQTLAVEYRWKHRSWQILKAIADSSPQPIASESEAEFITEHYWGYTRISQHQTSEYEVTHPRWLMYPVKEFAVQVNFEEVYGTAFGFLNQQQPRSVFLAEGSAIEVKDGGLLENKPLFPA